MKCRNILSLNILNRECPLSESHNVVSVNGDRQALEHLLGRIYQDLYYNPVVAYGGLRVYTVTHYEPHHSQGLPHYPVQSIRNSEEILLYVRVSPQDMRHLVVTSNLKLVEEVRHTPDVYVLFIHESQTPVNPTFEFQVSYENGVYSSKYDGFYPLSRLYANSSLPREEDWQIEDADWKQTSERSSIHAHLTRALCQDLD